ncbi:MAG: hypothetical protein ABR538_14105 [Candidatus Binatia bacterium]
MNANRFGRWLTAFSALLIFTHAGVLQAEAQTADLSITKTLLDPAIPPALGINPGNNIVYSIVVTNLGPDEASNVVVEDDTPAGVTFVSNTGDCVSAFPCSLGTLTNGQSKTITSTYTVPANYAPPTSVTNSADVYSSTSDPVYQNDFDYTDTPINGNNCGNFAVSGGEYHTCAIVAGNGKASPNNVDDDLVECWGSNADGQSYPVPAGAFEQVSSGGSFTCGLRPDGSVECWGSDTYGIVTNTPGTDDFTQIAAGFDHACGLRSDDTITCWGLNNDGQASAPSGLFTQVAAGDFNSCGVHTDGTIECWGDNSEFQVTTVPTDDDFVQVTVGAFRACGRRADGTVDCWGANYSGESDDPTGSFTSITSGAIHNCGLRADSTVECWGDDDEYLALLDAPGDAFSDIEAGGYFTCGLLSDGTILCWGFQAPLPPSRSDKCPTCGDGKLEGREECEACLDGICEVFGSCTPSTDPPPEQVCNTELATCCSPVTCTAYRLSENHICRAANGGCDAPEVCNGVNFDTCPGDTGPRPANFVCRLALGGCDAPEVCDGTDLACPAPGGIRPLNHVCRAEAGSCDVVEVCDGVSVACPADTVVAASTLCRAAAGFCDVDEVCNGTSATCPSNSFKASNVECRGVAGVCDVAESCSGTAANCPNDSFLNSSVTCRTSNGVCDAPEQCPGNNANCPADILHASTVTCRAAVDVCDAEEKCTGLLPACPLDTKQLPGTNCRSAVGVCDAQEVCDGLSDSCPADLFSASSVVCRSAVDGCDVTENCTGTANECPADAFAGTEVSCNDGAFCNGADNCDGSGGCALHEGDPCPGADGDGDCAETCDEGGDNCLAADVNGSSCNDGDICTDGETCTAGTCGGGGETQCDDGSLCTEDSCDAIEGCQYEPVIQEVGCFEAAKGLLAIKNNQVPEDAQLKWQWKKGDAVGPELLGAPDVDTDYTLCIFDQAGGEPVLSGSYVVPAATSAWTLKYGEGRGSGSFVNKISPPDGISNLKAKAYTTPGKSSASVKASGASLDLPLPFSINLYFQHTPSLVAQLRNSEGACWTTEFLPAEFKKNDGGQAKAAFKR